ncbi:MAG TPA: serine hydroxymethyltransferase [Patescibacteria group bacterium]|jgi:glycine hydroxymethyltransferase|nr:serine hydroxymethyltransferase [Patescibacteria group bacterium]
MKYEYIQQEDPAIADIIKAEEQRQKEGIEMIPSENYVSGAVLEALGSVMTNKYSEGYPHKRYYGGQENTDQIEEIAIDRAKQLFKAEHVNVQPLSGAPANVAVYFALLQPGDTVLGMDLSHGGHLTHGHPVTYMAKLFNFIRYKMKDVSTGEIDYDELRQTAIKEKPKIILAGFSAYPREIDYAKMKSIADEVGAITMMDAAHIAGLIAGEQLRNPFDDGFDIVTTTTHKTLRGPRGGMIMSRESFAKAIDKSVFPGFQGGPHMNNIAAKAVAFGEALKPEFKTYAAQVIKNAAKLSEELQARGAKLITGGTSNHLMLVDAMTSWNVPGKLAQQLLDSVGITLNMNMIADDPRSPMDPSGIRLGTPAITTRGAKEEDMTKIADWMVQVLTNPEDITLHEKIRDEVRQFSLQFPVPGIK